LNFVKPIKKSPLEALYLYFDDYLSLDDDEKESLQARIIEKKLRRRHFILQENSVCEHYSFVVSGLLKMYTTDKNGIEHIIQFASENQWVADISSIHKHQPSRMNIEAIEDTIVLQLKKNDLHYLLSAYPKFERNFRVIIENKFMELEQRLLENISTSTEEKYLSFLSQNENISNRIPNNLIASYLGITPEFLSKIRSKISRK
jgi:CRP-like cAMP-binding protein